MYPLIALGSFIGLLLFTIPVAIGLGYAALIPGWLGASTCRKRALSEP